MLETIGAEPELWADRQHRTPLAQSTERLVALTTSQIRCSIVVSICACHAEDPGSIPGGGVFPTGS